MTRSRDQASSLSERLCALGASVVEIPTIAILPPLSYAPLDAALASLAGFDWLVVTSANTARVLSERLAANALRLDRQPQTVAVGPSTAAALRTLGWRVDLVPEPAVAESVVAALQGKVGRRRVLLARAQVARDLIPEALGEAGAEVTVVDAYRTVLAEDSAPLVRALFGAESLRTIDALTFTSSSTAKNFAALLEMTGLQWPEAPHVLSIGPVTSATLRGLGVEPKAEAAQHDVEGLVRCAVAVLADRSLFRG